MPELLKTTDFTHLKDYKGSGSSDTGLSDIPSEYLGTDWLFRVGQANTASIGYSSGNIIGYMQSAGQYIAGYTVIPIYHKKALGVKFTITSAVYNYTNSVNLYKIQNGALVYVWGKSITNVTDYSVDVTFSEAKDADYIVIGTVKLERTLVISNFKLLCED